MPSLRSQDRVSLCRFTFSDGRQCRTPRSHFCFDHARKESQACAASKLASEISYYFSGEYLSACDLRAALACPEPRRSRLVPAVACGDIKPRAARMLAYSPATRPCRGRASARLFCPSACLRRPRLL
jgi:hypothetical protein